MTTEAQKIIVRPIPQHDETGPALLRILWEQIKEDGSAWNQGTWIGAADDNTVPPLDAEVLAYIEENQAPPWNCGTAYCIAGHTVLAKGALLPDYSISNILREEAMISQGYVINPNDPDNPGRSRSVEFWAQEILELDSAQAAVLFDGSRSAREIELLVTAFEADQGADFWAVLGLYSDVCTVPSCCDNPAED